MGTGRRWTQRTAREESSRRKKVRGEIQNTSKSGNLLEMNFLDEKSMEKTFGEEINRRKEKLTEI